MYLNTAPKSYIQKTLLSLVILIAFITPAFAIEDETEAAREDEFENQLLLTVPEETDNPTHTLVFTDPSDKGVYITIDGQQEVRIVSPYLLPSLAVGDHKLVFRFTDKEETEQTLQREIIVLPRPPEIKPPQVVENQSIVLTGEAMPNSTVYIFLAGAIDTYTTHAEVDLDGVWEHIFSGPFADGIYTVTAVARRDGFSSNYGEAVVFKIETTDTVTTTTVEQDEETISFSLATLVNTDISKTVKQNPDIAYYTAGLVVTGWILGTLINSLFSSKKEKKSEKQFLKLLNKDVDDELNERKEENTKKKEKDTKEEEKPRKSRGVLKKMLARNKQETKNSIKEKLENSTPKKEDKTTEEKKDTKEEEKPTLKKKKNSEKETKDKEETKEISKEDFLKTFKQFDPDTKDGTEILPEKSVDLTEEVEGKKKEGDKEKDRNIKITLTSGSLK